MIEEIMAYIHNYFERRKVRGVFSILNGQLDGVTFIQDGQYYRIKGSVFNDGVWMYGTDVLHDETFIGEVWCLAVPPAFINIVDEIKDWNDKNKDAVQSPFTSESFGGYSYSKATESTGNNGSSGVTWRSVFGSRLNEWRKIS